SSDEKLLAYVAGQDIKIYLIENGLELSSLSCKGGSMHNVEFMKFVFNNDKLLIFKDDRTVAVWDIFNSVGESIEFEPLEKDTTSGLVKQVAKIIIDPISENDPFLILTIRPSFHDDKQVVWDKLELSEHLKRKGLDPNWYELDPKESIITDTMPHAYGIGFENSKFVLTDLENEHKRIKFYLGIEPWAVHPAEKILDTYVKQRLQFPRYVIYLEKNRH
ncbi:17140_t:CDS:1, partial [Dentiscutata erythropus]